MPKAMSRFMKFNAAAALLLAIPSLAELAHGAGSPRPEGGAFDDTPKANDWYTSGPDCSLYAGADFDGDGLDDLFTFNAGRQLFYSPNVHGWKAAGWQMILENGPENAVALQGGDWIADLPGEEIAIVGPHEVRVVGRPKDGKFDQVVALAAPDGVTLVLAVRAEDKSVHLIDAAGAEFAIKDRAIVPTGVKSEPPSNDPADHWRSSIHAIFSSAISGSVDALARGWAPPYEPDARVVTLFEFGSTRAGGKRDLGVVYDCHLPHDHHLIRVVAGPDPAHLDSDADGLTDQQERELGSDPLDRDTDDDSLLDGWEVNGLPRGIDLGPDIPLYSKDRPEAERDKQLNPLRQDVICNVSYFDGVDPKQFANEIPQVQRLYRELNTPNPDGSHGIWVHVRPLPMFVAKADQTLGWWDIGAKYCPKNERGLVHWMQVTPWGGGQAAQTGDMGGCGNGWAVFAHEFGHQMSLGHEGDSAASWCPLYPSLMSYAFSYSFDGDGNKIHFSRGQFRDTVLDERNLSEKLAYPYADLKYLANWPFRFTLKDNGDGTTMIDWNHNGKFDETPVEADINYGGSTNCGTRANVDITGTGPALAYVGDVCYLASVDQTRDHVWLRQYKGDNAWNDPRTIPNTATEREPLLVGGKDYGLMIHHHIYGWHVTKFTETEIGTPVKIPDVPPIDLSVCRVGDRVLLVTRNQDDTLDARWMTFKDNDFTKPVVTPPTKLEVRSVVPAGLGVEPGTNKLIVATAYQNSRGVSWCMRVTWCNVNGDRIHEQETKWTRGEGSGNGTVTRPIVAFSNAGQLYLFHQGGPGLNGQMIAYRTSRVGNTALDEGWLTCMLYDVWTSSRVPIAFANGPQGAVFSYRWDPTMPYNQLQTAGQGFGIDTVPMRDFDDSAKMSKWGIRHSIMTMLTDEQAK
ncbi:MAG: hypothetical protein U0638_07675 [Phycisphaerales bacterium]